MKDHISDEKGGILDDDRTLVGYLTLISELLSLFTPLISYEQFIEFE
jgi:hypothetical protein